MKQRLAFAAVCAIGLFANGCMVGPKYSKPTTPMAPAFKEQPPESFKEVDGWKPAQPGDQTLRGKWWEIFGDPQLNVLEEQLTVSNQDLKVSEARFRQARSIIRFNRAAQFPTISTSPSPTECCSRAIWLWPFLSRIIPIYRSCFVAAAMGCGTWMR